MIDRRDELAEFVRSCRERLAPTTAGLTAGTRRRTPGLRREEVAQLSGVSTTWYTWIEQGREVSASPAALARLAAVLRLTRAERAYLFELAGKRDPEPAPAGSNPLPAVLPACLASITAPAYVLDRTWTARSWNPAARRLFVGWLDRPGERNLLRFVFLSADARTLIADWEVRARRVVAEFRAATSVYRDDPALLDLIAGLQRDSADFARAWEQHDVVEREGGTRTFTHPTDGLLTYQQVTFDLASQPDLKLTMLVAA